MAPAAPGLAGQVIDGGGRARGAEGEPLANDVDMQHMDGIQMN